MKTFEDPIVYKNCLELRDKLKEFLISAKISTGHFISYPHFLLLEDDSLTHYIKSCKDPVRGTIDVYDLTCDAEKVINKAIFEFNNKYNCVATYAVDNLGDIQFWYSL